MGVDFSFLQEVESKMSGNRKNTLPQRSVLKPDVHLKLFTPRKYEFLSGREHLPRYLAKTHPDSIFFGKASDGNPVAVLHKGSG